MRSIRFSTVPNGPPPGSTNTHVRIVELQPPAVFDPELVATMGEALDLAWAMMLATNHACTDANLRAETRRQLALAIVEAASAGISDRALLSESALRCLFPLGLDGEGRDQPAQWDEEASMGLCVTSNWLSPGPSVHERQEWLRFRTIEGPERDGSLGRQDDHREKTGGSIEAVTRHLAQRSRDTGRDGIQQRSPVSGDGEIDGRRS